MTVAFDTLKLARRLEAAGFSTQQAQGAAEALADTMTGDLATRGDIAELRSELHETELRLRADLSSIRSDLRAEMSELRAELPKWVVGTGIAGVLALSGVIFTALRLPHS